MPTRPSIARPSLALSLTLFSPLACTPDKGGEDASDDKSDEGVRDDVVHEQPCPDPQRATPPVAELCPPERQITRWTGGGDCPAPPIGSAWTLEELFPLGAPAKLDNYCRYLWTGGGAPVMTDLPAGVQGTTGPDCRVFVQSPLETTLGPSYQAAFLAALEPVPQGVALGPGYPIDVVVVDTAPADPRSVHAEHGPTIAAIVAGIAGGCVPGLSPSGECQRRVATRLGLPQIVGEESPDLVKGGYFGYQSDLAQGIYAAYASWTNHDHRLVVNLSVGWEPSTGDLDASGQAPSPSLAAVRDTVDLLRCSGALVIAASGNQPQGSCVDAPTGPGAWEQHATPNATQCSAFGLPAPASPASYRPLLYAATPLDWSGSNLPDFRPGSDARLATLGFGGYASTGATGHGPLSGSSVATAAISGVATSVWSYFPGLTGDEVMALIYASGEPRVVGGQAVQADFALAGASAEQRSVTVCGALLHGCDTIVATAGGATSTTSLDQAKCDALEFHCNKTWRDDAATRQTAWWQQFAGALDQLGADERKDLQAPARIEQDCDRCGAAELTRLPADEALPASAMPDPWVLPQPEKPPCPMCQIKDDDIYLSLDATYSGYALQNVSVRIFDAIGTLERLDYGPMALSPTIVTVVTDAELRTVGTGGTTPIRASITMVFSDAATGRTITAGNAIPIGP